MSSLKNSAWDLDVMDRFYTSHEIEFLTPAQQSHCPERAFAEHGALILHTIGRLAALRQQGVAHALDVGCNSGLFTAALTQLSSKVTGVDYSEPLLRSARARHRGLSFLRADAREIPFGDGEFGVVTCFGMIHWLPFWQEIVRECLRVTVPGGLVAFQFYRARSAWQDLCRSGLGVLLGRRSFLRECTRLKRVLPFPPRHLWPWLTRDGKPLTEVLSFGRSLGAQLLEVHESRGSAVFPGQYVSVILLKPPNPNT